MASTSVFKAPQWVNSLYAKYPLVVLNQEDTLDWKSSATSPYTLWIHPPAEFSSPHYRSWASVAPASLRAQLLFLLRPVSVRFQPWGNEDAAPGAKLPTLHLIEENKLVAADEIRQWLDSTHPLQGKSAKLHGMPDQGAYDEALAVAQLVLVRLLPALLASTNQSSATVAPLLPQPPALVAGLTTPLPVSFTGDDRSIDHLTLIESGIQALETLQELVGRGQWAQNAKTPTPLDALIASHLYCIYALSSGSPLREKLEGTPELGSYVDRVLDLAANSLQQ
ncbi:hypothetical protein Q8F55_001019 [Vanrija albida]|uniref:Metaxin glutathione S-transferase domain-containing protein n=1 Tax=Vanrija albida TaxID=181172 RepID=A0ABR3QEW7_9TREE